ncbi:tellurite resistance TerB family protein [Ignatzschineria larvae DSM 13226]|uniref:Tellurite resistance TerB family protein n=1 Tax=Ignatzschineria larvae DSM 13226 TaxID=1111732 RepID=A0ABZ3C100_9GAMM|nr:tellurite resistance TerB family protein [Ignatzschineria larvae]
MSFLNKIKEGFKSGRDELTRQVSRFKNQKFMQGTVAICAYVAMASDGVSPEEKHKMMGFLRTSPELSIFDTNEVIEFFNKIVASYDFDMDIGRGEAMKYIVNLKNQPEAAQLAVRVGIAVGKSDGDFDQYEQNAVTEIIAALSLDAESFGL